MTSHRITYEGPAEFAVDIATALADADGVDLRSSDPITKLAGDSVRLGMTAAGSIDAIGRAVAALRSEIPVGATITVGETDV